MEQKPKTCRFSFRSTVWWYANHISHLFICRCWSLLHSAILHCHVDSLRSRWMWFWTRDCIFLQCFWISTEAVYLQCCFGCYNAGATWNCCHLGAFSVHHTTMHHVTSLHSKPHMKGACMFHCNLPWHFWQNDWDLSCAVSQYIGHSSPNSFGLEDKEEAKDEEEEKDKEEKKDKEESKDEEEEVCIFHHPAGADLVFVGGAAAVLGGIGHSLAREVGQNALHQGCHLIGAHADCHVEWEGLLIFVCKGRKKKEDCFRPHLLRGVQDADNASATGHKDDRRGRGEEGEETERAKKERWDREKAKRTLSKRERVWDRHRERERGTHTHTHTHTHTQTQWETKTQKERLADMTH